jgi:7-cyano-7-deazaguanine synthase
LRRTSKSPRAKASVALVSGGLDSVLALHLYVKQTASQPLVLTFDYGQPAARREISAAAFFAECLRLQHRVIPLPWMKPLVPKALSGRKADDAAVWVPNRNAVFIAIAAAIAESLGGGDVVLGFNRDEGASFSDNTPEFMAAANRALHYSTGGRVRVVSPTVHMSKAQMAKKALALGIDTSRLWSCYGGAGYHCGVCPSCKRLFAALADNQPAPRLNRR